MFPMTKTDIAKGAVQMIVALNATKLAEQQVDRHTSLDIETIPVKVGTTIAGQLAAQQLRPVTDKIVDATIRQAVMMRLRFKLAK
jgi:hypothetical protein